MNPNNIVNIQTDNNFTVCFTGHRPKAIFPVQPYAEEKRPLYQKIVDDVNALVLDLIAQGYTHFITGGAQGFDQLAFWAVHSAKSSCSGIINDVYIPFIGQENRWAKTGIFSQKEYIQMLQLADNVYTCAQDVDTSDYKQTVKALMYRNECMVNASTIVIGMHNDDSWKTARKGGTAGCLQYADKQKKHLIVRNFGSFL